MDRINVRHQSFLGSFSFCGLAEVDLTLAALNRAFPLLSAADQQKLSGFLDGFQAFALSASQEESQEMDFFDELSEYEDFCDFE